MTNLPRGWAQATVGEIADLTDGPFGSNLKTAHYTETGPRVIRLQNIGDGVFRDEHAHVDQARYERLIKHAVRPSDIVAASLGESVPRACLIPGWLGSAIVKADCIRVRAHEGIDPGFLMWMLNSPPVRAQAASSIKGVGRPRLGLGGLRNLTVPVPPDKEQRRILAAIEEQLSRLDSGHRLLRRALVNIGRLRSAILMEAFAGDWPLEPLASITDPERPVRYGILMPKEHVEDGILYVRVKDYPRGKIEVKGLRRTSAEIADKYRRSTLRSGDVLLAIRGTYGRVAIVPDELEAGNITQDTARIAPLPHMDARFLATYLVSEQAQRYFRRVARGVAVKGLNIGDLRTMPIPVPPLGEQRRIVARTERELSIADAMTAETDRAVLRSGSLRRAILGAAFVGRLVAQDPDDEPASALIRRITAARAREPNDPRKRRKAHV